MQMRCGVEREEQMKPRSNLPSGESRDKWAGSQRRTDGNTAKYNRQMRASAALAVPDRTGHNLWLTVSQWLWVTHTIGHDWTIITVETKSKNYLK